MHVLAINCNAFQAIPTCAVCPLCAAATGHAGAQQAAHACLTAHLLRYGRVPDALLTKLMTERAKVSVCGGGVLGWCGRGPCYWVLGI